MSMHAVKGHGNEVGFKKFDKNGQFWVKIRDATGFFKFSEDFMALF